jgi:hypothetical protein
LSDAAVTDKTQVLTAYCDGITAFEKPSTSNELTRAPPPLRPKPAGGVSWKPKPPSRLRTPLLSLKERG